MIIASTLSAASDRESSHFDGEWKFVLGDRTGAESVAFDDSQWRLLDVPHDWSIEDLPLRESVTPELLAVPGQWRFRKGDDAAWKARELARLPLNVYGWFRRHIEITPECKGRDFDLLLGRIDDVDEAWLNGERIGGTGSFPPAFNSAWGNDRRYRVSASLVRGDGTDVLAVRVYEGKGKGGIYAAGLKSARVGPFDTALSEGGNGTGYVLGGVGWYRKHFKVTESNKRVAVRFDGVYMNADFWINGHFLGNHPHGYTSFEFDLTPHLSPPGQENVLAVCVHNEGRNSRWYSGSGIYRHVWLTLTDLRADLGCVCDHTRGLQRQGARESLHRGSQFHSRANAGAHPGASARCCGQTDRKFRRFTAFDRQ